MTTYKFNFRLVPHVNTFIKLPFLSLCLGLLSAPSASARHRLTLHCVDILIRARFPMPVLHIKVLEEPLLDGEKLNFDRDVDSLASPFFPGLLDEKRFGRVSFPTKVIRGRALVGVGASVKAGVKSVTSVKSDLHRY